MSVRPLRAKQRGPRCSYCDERATYRGVDFTRFACDFHRTTLAVEDARMTAPDYSDAAFQLGLEAGK